MAVKVDVYIDKVLMDKFTSWNGPVGRSFQRLARMSVVEAKALAPKRTGQLMGSIKYKKMSGPRGLSFDLGSNAKHALWMEKGTKPHQILPKTPGGRLVFYWAKMGRVVHLKSVNHPGTKPYRYLENGFKTALRLWNKIG